MKKNRKSAQSPASTAPAPYRHLQVEAIEPRILFSGAPVEPTETETADAQAPADEATEPVLAVSPEAPAAADGAGVSGDSGATLVATGSGTADLNAETLAAIADAAKQRWIDAGISAEQLSALNSVTYQISDLSGNALGKANGFTITIDRDAAGSNAWFIDSTPLVDEEFGATGTALADGGAAGAYDLLSTVLHEQGHVLGLADVPGDGAAVMNGLLSQGARRSPAAGTANGAVVGSVEGDAFLTGIAPSDPHGLPENPANSPIPTDGTGTFSDSGQALGNHQTLSVALGDVDGDGDLDLVAGNTFSQANRVWLNNGSGSFTDSGQALGNYSTNSVALGDVDGDGDLDLVEGNYGQANQVFLNNGAGTFSNSGQSLGSHSTFGVALGDVDGDGDLDLVEGNRNQANRVWLNNGSGSFTDSGQLLGNHNTWSVALGDVDGDGDLDMVEGNVAQANRVWLNNGSGTFSDSGQALGNHSTTSVALGDVDGDGDLDLVEGNYDQANRVWLNNGSGTFSDSGQALGNHKTYSVALGDVDGDGDLDLVEGNRTHVNLVWLNNGSGSFTDSGQALGKYSTRSVALGDLDGDGDLDLVEGNSSYQTTRVWLNQNQPQTDLTLTKTSATEQVVQGGAVTYTITVSNAGPLAVTGASVTDTFSPLLTGVSWSAVFAGGATGAANGSGDIYELVELPVGSSITYTVNATVVDADTANLAAQSIVTNTARVSLPRGFADSNLANNADTDSDIVVLAATGGTGSFSDSGQALGDHRTYSVALGDVDGDGDLDFIEGNGSDRPNRVWLNDGSGSFTDSGQALGYHSTHCVALGDVDGDGDLDLVEGNRNQANRVWLNNGAGSFSDSGQMLGNHYTRSVVLGDVDGDGDLDLVEGNTLSQANRVWLNNGAGTFSDSGQTLGNGFTRSVVLGDVDGDGDLDLVEGNRNQANRVWLNNGSGSFSDSGQALGDHRTLSVALGDVDGDGDLDLVEGNADQANRVWLNNGSGSFSDSGQALGNHVTYTVALGDVDGDGDLDLVEGNRSQANRVWLNNGTGSFTDSGQTLGNHSTFSMALGDVDGDGDLDFVEGSYLQPNRVWLNQYQPQTDLTLTKTSATEQVVQGGAVTYTITVSNAGPLAVTGASVTDTFSPLLTGVSWSAVYAGGATGAANGSGDIDELVDLPVGSSITYTVNATVVDAGTANLAAQSIVTNTAQVSLPRGFADSNLANNADTDSDIVVLAATGGTGTFSDSGQFLGTDSTLSVALGDVDGDGDLDLIEGNGFSRTNRVLINDGAGSFTDSGQALGNHFTFSLALGDVDGDGDIDLVEGNDGNQANRVWLNNGSGTFSDSGQALGNQLTVSVALGDLDGDGDLDLVEGTIGQGNRVWLNNGAGTFTDSGQALGNHRTFSMALGDVDGDGDLDMVEGNLGNQANRVWQNNGAGTFTDSGQALGDHYTSSVALGDVDGDGDLDMVEGNAGFQANRVWLNNGAGSFTDSGQALGDHYTTSVALGDVDGDGDLDLVVGNFYNNGIRVWLNDGVGTFSDSGQALGKSYSRSVALGDLDGDGDLDLVEGNSSYQPNRVWLNENGATDTTTATVDPSGNLVIEDVAGGDTDDDLTIVIDGTDYLITDPTNGVTIRIPLASVTGDIIVNGNGGDDTLTVDLTGGLIPRNIVFNGGTGGDDALVISDTSGRTYGSFTHSADNANDGNIEIDGLTITYTGLEPINDNLVIANRVFNFTGGIDAITVTDDGATITIDSPLAESVTFTRPTNSLTIIGDADDTVTVTNATTLAADVSITAGTFEIAGGASLDLSAATTPAAAIIANRVLIGGALNTGAAGNITFTPLTTGNVQRFLLGSGADPVDDSVRISAAEISRLTAGLITVGDSETGTITVDADIVLPADLTLVTPGTVNFNRKINGNFDLSIVSGGTTVARPPGLGGIGALTPLDTITTDAGGTTRVQNGGVINSTGDQTYNDLFMVGTTEEGVGIATLTAPTVNFSATTDYHLDLNGDAGAGLVGGHDQLAVVGALNLGGATVTVDLGFTPAVGNTYTIITNDGADAVSGTFVQGASVAALFGGTVSYFDIDYAGGDGNDVVLTVAAGPSVIYVDDSFAALAANTIVDGDRELGGSQLAYVGANAFGSIAAALAAHAGFNGEIIVNAGTYASDIDLTGAAGDITLRLVQDLTAGETELVVEDITTDALDAIDTSFHGTAVDIATTGGDIAGVISGLGGLTINATGEAGLLILSGANTYSGDTLVVEGELRVNNLAGSGTGSGDVTIEEDGLLTGTGAFTGALTVEDGGTVSPGVASLHGLPIGDLTLETGSTYLVDLDAAPGNDSLVVTGTVTLNNADLDLVTSGVMPGVGTVFTLIQNDGTDPVVGTFNGLAEGNFIAMDNGSGVAGTIYRISYRGGTGNDVTLTGIATATTSVAVDGSGNLVIEDVLGANSLDNLFIGVSGGNLIIRDNNGNALGTLVNGAVQTALTEIRVDLTLFTGDVIINTLGGADQLTIGTLTGLPGGFIFDGGTGFDRVDYTANSTLAADADFNVTAEQFRAEGRTLATTGDGDITVTATDPADIAPEMTSYIGLSLVNATFTSVNGDITLSGEGGRLGVSANEGVRLNGATVTSATGNILISGTGGGAGGGSSNYGVVLYTTSVASTVSTGGSGNITINGTGGTGTGLNTGIDLQGGASVNVADGLLQLNGTGGTGAGNQNRGVGISAASLNATGTGQIEVNGTGGGTGNNSSGILLTTAASVAANGGGVTLRGTGATGGTESNEGIKIINAATVTSTAGNLVLQGTGGGSARYNRGVYLLNGTLTATAGSVSVTGTGSATSTGLQNQGIFAQGSSVTAGTSLTFTGNGGRGTSNNHGVQIHSTTLNATGALSVTGTAHAMTTGSLNTGVYVHLGSSLLGGGGSSITGFGGGGNNAHGIFMTADTTTTVPLGSIVGTKGPGTGRNETGGFAF